MSNPARPLELPRHPFRSIQQAAAELRQAAVATGATPLYLLPFNRYAPEDTEWWLAPAPDNPAYKHAKIALMAGEGSAPGDLFVGLSGLRQAWEWSA